MPTLLQVENLSRSYGEKILFENITFAINQFQKVALIAQKRCWERHPCSISSPGSNPPTAGSVQLFNNASYAYLTQDPDLNTHEYRIR